MIFACLACECHGVVTRHQHDAKVVTVVSEDGEVIEPMIEDSSGNEDFEREALRTVERWVYEPATVNGEPVEQALTQIKMIFQMEETPQGASSSFQRAYNAIVEHITANEFETAGDLLIDLHVID